MSRQIINTANAPAAIGPYSQAVRAGNTVYFSGQIPLDPATGEIVAGDVAAQARRAFDNLKAVATEAGGSLDQIVRLGLYLTDLGEFAKVNAVMQDYFQAPFPARSTPRRSWTTSPASVSGRASKCWTTPCAANASCTRRTKPPRRRASARTTGSSRSPTAIR